MYGDHSTKMKIQTLETYVMQIRQVAALLGYSEPQILEVFKKILPNILHWVLLPIDDLRWAVEMAKRRRQTIGRPVKLNHYFLEGK